MFQHIRMISEGSCDTEDLSNDAENSAAHHKNNLYFNIMQPWWAEETSFKTSKKSYWTQTQLDFDNIIGISATC